MFVTVVNLSWAEAIAGATDIVDKYSDPGTLRMGLGEPEFRSNGRSSVVHPKDGHTPGPPTRDDTHAREQ